jgi:transposase
VRSTARAKNKRHGHEQSKVGNLTLEGIWGELQRVRAALDVSEQRAERLERRVEELEAENKALRKKRGETEAFLQAKIRTLEKKVADRDRKLEAANKLLSWFRKNYFGPISESLQPSETDDSETPSNEASKNKGKGKKRARGQQRGSKGHGRTDRSNVSIADTVILEIPGGCACPDCGMAFLELTKTQDTSIYDIAMELYQTLFKQKKYVSQCDCRGKKIVTAPPPDKLYPRTDIGNSLWVHLLMQKFLSGVPTNRTIKELSLLGFSFAEGTFVGGCKIINDLLTPLMEEITNHCRGAKMWNADETFWRVFDSNKKKWWLWLIASDDATVYILDPSRSKKIPQEFFGGSAGTLMTDRFSSYKSLHDSIKKAWCWVHQRRDFLNIYNGVPSQKAWARKWLLEITKLFVLCNKRFALFSKGDFRGTAWQEAHDALKRQVRSLRERMQRELKNVKSLHPEQKKVLLSLKRHWDGLTIFVNDPSVPMHNNRAERLIRNSVILRKNSFGSGSEWSGELAAKLFSIIQTWLINGLDPHAMLLYYFDECSKTSGRSPPAKIDQFMPWKMSPQQKQDFALPASYKRPG